MPAAETGDAVFPGASQDGLFPFRRSIGGIKTSAVFTFSSPMGRPHLPVGVEDENTVRLPDFLLVPDCQSVFRSVADQFRFWQDGIELFPVAFMEHDGMAVIVECFHDCCGDGYIEAVCPGDALK